MTGVEFCFTDENKGLYIPRLTRKRTSYKHLHFPHFPQNVFNPFDLQPFYLVEGASPSAIIYKFEFNSIVHSVTQKTAPLFICPYSCALTHPCTATELKIKLSWDWW